MVSVLPGVSLLLLVLFLGLNLPDIDHQFGLAAPDQIGATAQSSTVITSTITVPITTSIPITGTATLTSTGDISPTTAFPDLLAEIALAAPGERLTNLLLDSNGGRLYITDSSYQLHVIETETYTNLATLPAGGTLTLDPANRRLYVALPGVDVGRISIVDIGTLTVTGTITPGGGLTVDPDRNQFYVGNRRTGVNPLAARVRQYDGHTLELLGRVDQSGLPSYNPMRDELYIVQDTVHIVTSDTLTTSGDLLPELSAQHQPVQVVTDYVLPTGAYLFPGRNLLAIDTVKIASAGKPPLRNPQTIFFDAATLTRLADPGKQLALVDSCSGRANLLATANNTALQTESYLWYGLLAQNLLRYDETGQQISWHDGLSLGPVNPNTNQMYLPYASGLLVLALDQMVPSGHLRAVDCVELDIDRGRLYGLREDRLLIYADTGGRFDPRPPEPVASLPEGRISLIRPSPDYDIDTTVFLLQGFSGAEENRLYRSEDGGEQWVRLWGGLAESYGGSVYGVELSPVFDVDRTLFAIGRGDKGKGIYRSRDGGDRWQPVWQGLTHLRVNSLQFSSDYAQDGTILALADFTRASEPPETGESLFRSIDQGLSWTLVMTSSNEIDADQLAEVQPSAAEVFPNFRITRVNGQLVVERSDDGQQWTVILRPLVTEPPFRDLFMVLSPAFDSDQTLYVWHQSGLFRSTDGGNRWQQWIAEKMAGWNLDSELSAVAATSKRLFIGTLAGEFWTLNPNELDWVTR